MRISDWSSDVCSSDLLIGLRDGHAALLDASTHRLAEDVAEIEHAHGGAGHAGNLHGRQLHAAGVLHLDLDFLIVDLALAQAGARSEEHTSELQSLMRISYAVFCLKKNTTTSQHD